MAPGIKGSSHTRYQLGAVRTDTLPRLKPIGAMSMGKGKGKGKGGKRGC